MRMQWMSLALIAGTLAAGTAAADHGHHRARGHETRYVYARVVDVEPIVRLVTVDRPRRECWQETVYESVPRPFDKAGVTLAGAIVGGAVGRQFGSGDGRDALTLIGSLAGAAVANEHAERRAEAYRAAAPRAVPVERCEVVNDRVTQRRIDGYRVTYEYRGRRHTLRMAEPPQDRIRLRVSVQPVGF